MEGDGDANIAYYALHEFHLMPWDYAALDVRRKAALVAMIQLRVERERKEKARAARKR